MKGQLRLMQVGFLSLLILSGVQCADLNCQCVISNSRYVTVETPLTTATTMGKTTMTDEMSTTAGGGGTATASPRLKLRIVISGFVDRSTDCVGRSQFERYGDFRYLVVIPKKAPDPGKPYAFTLSISGNFSAYSCPTSRKRRGVAPFDSALEDSSSEAYMVFARESYYLLIDSVRKPVTNLTSAVGDFFGITFTAEGSGTKLDGKLVVRSAAEVSNEFLRDQLTLILPGVGWSIVGLKIRSESSSDSSTPKPSFPVYAAVLISILCLLVLATVLILVLWRLKVIGGPPPRRLAYQASAGVESASSGVNSSEAIDISKWRLGSTLEAVACYGRAPANDLVSDDKDNFSKIAGDDNGV
uniref:Uncharacterized protein n=1 Tax=Macrostomum lignano TaxID=282301 RepID=A0A1I8JBP0_9PLAT